MKTRRVLLFLGNLYRGESRMDHGELNVWLIKMCGSSKEIVRRDSNFEAFRFNILLFEQERFKLSPVYLREGL